MEFFREMWEVPALLCFLRFAVFQISVGSALLWKIQVSLPWEIHSHVLALCGDSVCWSADFVRVTVVSRSPCCWPRCCCSWCCRDSALVVTWLFSGGCVMSFTGYTKPCVTKSFLPWVHPWVKLVWHHAGLQRDLQSLGTSLLFPMHVVSHFESGILLREKDKSSNMYPLPPVSSWLCLRAVDSSLPAQKAMSMYFQAWSHNSWILRALTELFISSSSSFRPRQWLVLKVMLVLKWSAIYLMFHKSSKLQLLRKTNKQDF